MNDHLNKDEIFLNVFEEKERIAKELGQTKLAQEYGWAVDLYTRYSDEVYKNDELRNDINERDKYIEEHNISPKEELKSYYRSTR